VESKIVDNFRIGIIGAGPAGLTLALALSKRKNFFIKVFEKSPDHRNSPTFNPLRSYTIDITGHGAKAVKYVGLKERFNSDLIHFKGIRLPILPIELEESYHGDAWTGSRGDIVKAIQNEIIETTSESKNVSLLFETEANIESSEKGIISYNQGKSVENFDLIIACDGAGSTARNQLSQESPSFQVRSLDNNNFSRMLPFDQNTTSLNPSYLYIFGLPPYLAVAGAINGKKGPSDPLWFCQIGYSGSRKFSSFEEAKNFLHKNYPNGSTNCLTHYITDKAIEEFASQENISTGKAKICSSFSFGKVVLIGDAASPFPPVGQGVNAAMEMAMVLDQCIGDQLLQTTMLEKDLIFTHAISKFTSIWKPEAEAIRTISFKGLNLKSFHPPIYGKIKTLWSVLLHKMFHRDPMTNAKREDMTYAQSLRRVWIIDTILIFGVLTGLVIFFLNF
jgi:kynurenine 3-monooxygenase